MVYLIIYLHIILILVFDIWPTFKCPVTEKNISIFTWFVTPVNHYSLTFFFLFKLRATQIISVQTHKIGFYASWFPYISEIWRCGKLRRLIFFRRSVLSCKLHQLRSTIQFDYYPAIIQTRTVQLSQSWGCYKWMSKLTASYDLTQL